MKLLRSCLGGLLAAGLFAPMTSEAATVRAGLGADYWIDQSAAFNFTLGVEGRITGPLSVGARFGAVLITDGNDVGVPLDLYLRANVARSVYIEGMAGPWIVFGRGDEFRAHAAVAAEDIVLLTRARFALGELLFQQERDDEALPYLQAVVRTERVDGSVDAEVKASARMLRQIRGIEPR